MKANSVPGDINITSSPIKSREIDLHIVSGDVTFTFTGQANTQINMRSTSGNKNSKLSPSNNLQFISSEKKAYD